MKKILLLSSALTALAATSAHAQISVNIGEPTYAERPVVVEERRYPTEYYYGRHGHRQPDRENWDRERHARELRERERDRDHDRRW